MSITLQTKTTDINSKQLIERLKLQKKMLVAQVKEKGFKLGVQSSNCLSYQELQRLERLTVPGVRIDAGAFDGMWELLQNRQSDNNIVIQESEFNHSCLPDDDNKTAFVEGWIEGVLCVWHQIKDQVDNTDLD